jgi:hypothetical protein
VQKWTRNITLSGEFYATPDNTNVIHSLPVANFAIQMKEGHYDPPQQDSFQAETHPGRIGYCPQRCCNHLETGGSITVQSLFIYTIIAMQNIPFS